MPPNIAKAREPRSPQALLVSSVICDFFCLGITALHQRFQNGAVLLVRHTVVTQRNDGQKQTDSRRDRTQEEHHPRILGELILKGRTGTQSLVAGAYIVAAKAHDGVADALNNGADPGGQLGNKRLAGEEHTVRR